MRALDVPKRYRNGIVKEHRGSYGARRPEFVFDVEKSDANAEKHGIDFIEAQRLWDDPSLTVDAARSEAERRFIATGVMGCKYWSAVFTMRGHRVRLISVRRARPQEVQHYEGE